MLDRWALGLLAPPMTALARGLVRTGVGADAVTFAGFGIGLAGAAAIALQAYGTGLALLLASRLCDGLDGAVARLTQTSDRGAFLDIALDFIFYASVPLAIAVADPAANALAAAVLLAAFVVKSLDVATLRWGVVVVVLYAAAALLWSAARPRPVTAT